MHAAEMPADRFCYLEGLTRGRRRSAQTLASTLVAPPTHGRRRFNGPREATASMARSSVSSSYILRRKSAHKNFSILRCGGPDAGSPEFHSEREMLAATN